MLHTKMIWFSFYVSPIREEPFEKFLTAWIITCIANDVLYALLGGNGQSPPKEKLNTPVLSTQTYNKTSLNYVPILWRALNIVLIEAHDAFCFGEPKVCTKPKWI